ncbi:MAG: hypothetical protein GF350_13815 [Chitinivibrionales bacterium]|nr:hypothetical protein [Chitinivibrionales bacterium]
MDGYEKIEKNIVNGLVLDEAGKWVPLSEKIRQEKEFLNNLEKGRVYYNKSWMTFDERKAAGAQAVSEVDNLPGNPGETATTTVSRKSGQENVAETGYLTVGAVRKYIDEGNTQAVEGEKSELSIAPVAAKTPPEERDRSMEWEQARKKGTVQKVLIIALVFLAIIAAVIGFVLF